MFDYSNYSRSSLRRSSLLESSRISSRLLASVPSSGQVYPESAVRRSARPWPRRVVVYCHDLFGMGNLRRMLRLSRHLLDANEDIHVLVLSGNPAIHRFDLPERLEYVKLPCLTRGMSGNVSSKRLPALTSEMIRLRAAMILSATKTMEPDLLLVDKKPRGACNELDSALRYLDQQELDQQERICPRVLVLRDILDEPEITRKAWKRGDYYKLLRDSFDRILVVGERHVFDVAEAYGLDSELQRKLRYCGYMHIAAPPRSREEILRDRGLDPSMKTVLVSVGGGEDGARVLDAYLDAVDLRQATWQSVIVSGPELPEQDFWRVRQRARKHANVYLSRFRDDILSMMKACDLTVSMAGYNTLCEALSMGKPIVVVPRAGPTREQRLRAQLMAGLGWLDAVAPDVSGPELFEAVKRRIECGVPDHAGSNDRTSSCVAPINGAVVSGAVVNGAVVNSAVVNGAVVNGAATHPVIRHDFADSYRLLIRELFE